MIDYQAICNALAARHAPGTMATPSGASAIRGASGQMPKGVPATPYMYVEPTSGTVVAQSGTWDEHHYMDAVFLLAKKSGDPARVEKQRQIWLPSLLTATTGQMKLGLGAQSGYSVKSAFPQGYEWDEVDVGGDAYDAIRVHYDVWVQETVTLVAA